MVINLTTVEKSKVKLKTHLEYWINRVVSELDDESVEIIEKFDKELKRTRQTANTIFIFTVLAIAFILCGAGFAVYKILVYFGIM